MDIRFTHEIKTAIETAIAAVEQRAKAAESKVEELFSRVEHLERTTLKKIEETL